MQVWYRSRALYDTVMRLLNSGRYSEAMEIAEGIPDGKVKAMAFSKIALKLADEGRDYSKALERVVSVASDLPSEDSTKVLMGLAFDFLNVGRVEDALKVAEFVTDLPNRSKIQAEAALKLAREGKVAEAMEIINDILDEDVKTWAMSRMATTV
jgi:tetratricopeptide (TPR) repeat protein